MAFALVISLNVYVYGMIPSYVATLPASGEFPLLGAVASSCAMAASVVAKMLWGGLGERNILVTVIAACGCAVAGLALFAFAPGPWPLVCVAAVAYGMIYGEQTVFCPIVTRQFYGMRSYGELYSTVSTVICVGVIASSFIGGTIVNATGSYLAMFAFIGCALVAACLLLALATAKETRSLLHRRVVQQMMDPESSYVIVDVRSQKEFASGHISDAINIPIESIGTGRPAELPNLDQLIMTYCRSGKRSRKATAKLTAMGYTNVVDLGGINAKETRSLLQSGRGVNDA